nr:beta-xylosidase [Parvularcula dongshanensis]
MFGLTTTFATWSAANAVQDPPFPVEIEVDASTSIAPVDPIWRFFGADEPNYVYRENGEELIGELGELRPGEVYFRAHNLLTTGDGTGSLKWGSTNAYTEDEDGNPVYDWTIADRIFDTYLERGVKPYVEIGFMPEALSSKPEPYRHSWGEEDGTFETGWAYPPTDYEKWEELVYQWAKHCVERYGREEVESWYWQTWNEPNIVYWQGTDEEFLKLNDYAVAGLLRALPTARVAGPHTAGDGGDVARGFYEHALRGENYATGETGTKLDVLAFHAKGSPETVDGVLRMGIGHQLKTIDTAFSLIEEFPEISDKPIVIGESDPEGCAACQGEDVQYRNGTMYSSYTAAVFARKHELARRHDVDLEGALTWAFTFEDQPIFAGFRSLATHGIDKPVLNVFRMFSMMSGDEVQTQSSGAVPLDAIMADGVREEPDVAAYAARDGNTVTAMVWHYHDDMVDGPDAAVTLTFEGLPAKAEGATLKHYRIDEEHSNAFAAWQRMGSPAEPTAAQTGALEEASGLSALGEPEQVAVENGKAVVDFTLPRRGVSLLVLEAD